ncbi:MAG: hypothetical protein N3E52_03325 [Candidatus Bathyarchaeota archaeon]|nr:hypothetical protein [Candidatus Bathyarchaeota archaeon]
MKSQSHDKNKRVAIIDTSAFLAGFDPFSISEDHVTTPSVKEELRSNSIASVRFETAVENGKLKIKLPADKYVNSIKIFAAKIGDSFFLSETDMQLLALALEFNVSGYTTKIVTDDYSIQNVAIQLGIEFAPLATFGIRRLLKWIRYCPACRREYPADFKSTKCTICGTLLKRKPRKICEKL